MRKSSIQANEAMKPFKSSHYSIILGVLRRAKKSLTGRDIEQRCSLSHHQIMKRTSEMITLNLIETDGYSDQKRKPLLWKIVNK